MKKILDIFRLKHEERIPTLVATLLMAALIALPIYAYSDALTPISDNFRKIVIAHFRISGFDPLSYLVLTDWGTFYNVYRHPLLAFFMYPPYLLNQALTWLCLLYTSQATPTTCGLCTYYRFSDTTAYQSSCFSVPMGWNASMARHRPPRNKTMTALATRGCLSKSTISNCSK